MSLIAACRCGAKFQAPPHLAGRQVACPTCGQALVVPGGAAAAAPATPAAPAAPASGATPIAVACRCGKRFAAPPNLAGRQVQCPACKQPLSVPQRTPAAASGQAPSASPIPVACRCGNRFAAPPTLAGKQVACPSCRSPIQVPHPGAAAAPTPANEDGFWDQIPSDVKTPQEIYAEENTKKEPLAPNKATSYAIDRLARGISSQRVFEELREKGVGHEEAERIVEDLQDGKKRSIKGAANASHNSKVGMAFWGLSTPGGISLIGGIVVFILLFVREHEQGELLLLIALTAYLFIMGIGAIATSVMLQNRFKPARYIGFFFAIMYLCGSPLHLICGICVLISLSSGDMTEYLNEKS